MGTGGWTTLAAAGVTLLVAVPGYVRLLRARSRRHLTERERLDLEGRKAIRSLRRDAERRARRPGPSSNNPNPDPGITGNEGSPPEW